MTTAIRRARITAAARALCKSTSAEVGIDEDRNWKLNSDMFIADAKIAIKAADAIGTKAPRKLKKQDVALIEKQRKHIAYLEETMMVYRKTYGLIGAAA